MPVAHPAAVNVEFSDGRLLHKYFHLDRKSPNAKHMTDYFKADGGLFDENDKIEIGVNVFNVLDAYLYSSAY